MSNVNGSTRRCECPRCGAGGFERFNSHAYCASCNYADTPDSEEMLSIPDWVLSFISEMDKKKRKKRKRQSGPVLALALSL